MEERLQKIIAAAGLASRREAEEWIKTGLVKVNGQIVKELGSKADPRRDNITVGGQPLPQPQQKMVVMLNKPRGVITTLKDPQGRLNVGQFVESYERRLYPVGRLDMQSEGLLLLTDDGDFAYRMAHPKFNVEKTYLVWLNQALREEDRLKLEKGILLEGKMTLPARIKKVRQEEDAQNLCRITIREGRNRQIRKMFKELDYRTLRLMRVQIGNLSLGALPSGKTRKLRDSEIAELLEKIEGK